METPILLEPAVVAADTEAFTAYLPVPGLGVLPASAFLIRSRQPVLVDTGVVALGDAFFESIASRIDPADLRWIWITHTDPDHIGCVRRLLSAAPQARLVTTFLGMGKLGLSEPVAPERVYLLNPGQKLDVGDRELLAVRPPCYDAPETTGAFDSKTKALFTADAFGAVVSEPAERADAIDHRQLRDGLVTWATVDAPWMASVADGVLERSLAELRRLGPEVVLSSHLPPAPSGFEELATMLAGVRLAAPFVGPDQAALDQMTSAA